MVDNDPSLHERVIDALHALPSGLKTPLRISGIPASDLFTLNTPLGAAIKQSVVENLSDLREIWGSNDTCKLYSFLRQVQVFPDVRLQTTAPGTAHPILMAIELKGFMGPLQAGAGARRLHV